MQKPIRRGPIWLPGILLLMLSLSVSAGHKAGSVDNRDQYRLLKSEFLRNAVDQNEAMEQQPQRIVSQASGKARRMFESETPADNKRSITLEHPAIERAPTWAAMRGYEYHDGVNPPVIYWHSSLDDGGSWINSTRFNVDDAQYPSIDYWGSADRFFGTFVTPPSFLMGGGVILLEFEDAADSSTWVPWWTDFSDDGWHSMRMNDIAADNSQQSWNWGLISLVMSYTDMDTNIVDAPHIYSQINSLGYVQLSWYPTIEGCRSTAVDIDPAAGRTYAVYDWSEPDTEQWQLFIRQDYFNDWFLPTDASFLYFEEAGINLINPDIVVDNGLIIIVAESYSDTDSTDTDIVCWRAATGDVDDIAFQAVVAGTIGAETAPRIAHLNNDRFVCTFVRDNRVYATTSCDGGLTWPEAEVVSNVLFSATPEYRGSDISSDGQKFIYQHEQGGIPAGDLGCNDKDNDGICDCDDNCPNVVNQSQVDTDGDGVGDACDLCPGYDDLVDSDGDLAPDSCDNCLGLTNPDQSDIDEDGIGDACDECTDTDGDGYGNLGYAANTCPDDNCPDSANVDQADGDGDTVGDVCDNCPSDPNAGQEDADHDDIGDICDDCTDTDADGYGDPGFPFNTCGLDNCPMFFNPDQADSNSDGVGDACDGIICGDVDLNGSTNVADAVYIINFIFKGGAPPFSFWTADPNGDGTVNVSDAVYLITYIFKGGPAPDCP